MTNRPKRYMMAGIGVVLVFVAAPAAAGEAAWVAPPAPKATKNSLPRESGARDGKTLFDRSCRVCHGPAGKGDGPVAAALSPKPEDLTARRIQEQADGELFWKTTTGRGAMPAWGQLPETDRWNLVHSIRSLAGKR